MLNNARATPRFAAAKARTPMLLLLLTPNLAFAKGGGGVILGVIFLPILVWAFVKIWTFWFRLIFGGSREKMFAAASGALQPQSQPTSDSGQPETKECPLCAERILTKAKKCKHCGSAVA